MKGSNRIDYNDFLALSGADNTLVVDELIFVAIPDATGVLNEHSLLIHGSFDRERIHESVVNAGARPMRFRGISVLVVQPLPRERAEFNEVRWLAIPRPDLMLFGSPESVRRELERYLSHSEPDPALVARLANLRPDDETWTLMSPLRWSSDLRNALAVIDPVLAEDLKDGDALQFGIHYRKQVEFEYAITTASPKVAQVISSSLTKSLSRLGKGTASPLPLEVIFDGNTVHGIVKVPIDRYNEWLADVLTRERQQKPITPR